MTFSETTVDQETEASNKTFLKLVIPRLELVSLIGKIQSTVPSKPAIPILSNILIQADEGQVTLNATDLTVSIKAFATADVKSSGSITIPARRFFQLIRELTTDQIEIEETEFGVVFVRAGSSVFKLNAADKEEYPTLPDLSSASAFQVHSPTLKELFLRTSFAVAKEDSRHVLNGVLFQLTENHLTLIGTDGKRLAKVNAEMANQPFNGQYIVPLKAIEEVTKTLEEEQPAKLFFHEDKMAVEMGSVTVISKLLAGEYPDVSRVIPEKANMTVHLHREELMTLLRQVSLFTSEMSHSVRFMFTEGNLELSATSSDVGEGKVSMPVDFTGEQFEIAFNPSFFIDILKHCKDETVTFGITDSFNPGMITDQTTALFVIMPMRLNTN
ncbi:MAG: Beta sliding clamp [Chlamydiia bacterium]|nr:Beta sliding clamp [Chlamydiia bacterium]